MSSVAIAEGKKQKETKPHTEVIESVWKRFEYEIDSDCYIDPYDNDYTFEDMAYKIPWVTNPTEENDKQEFGYVLQLLCNVGAYNYMHRWHAKSPYGDVYPIGFSPPA